MEAYGDGFVISQGLIKGDRYTYLLDARTTLVVQGPEEDSGPERGVPLFFFALACASIGGIFWTQQGAILVLPLLVVVLAAGASLVKSFGRKGAPEWKLFVGTGEPVLLFSSTNAVTFEAKRNEIERALLGRPITEEEQWQR